MKYLDIGGTRCAIIKYDQYTIEKSHIQWRLTTALRTSSPSLGTLALSLPCFATFGFSGSLQATQR